MAEVQGFEFFVSCPLHAEKQLIQEIHQTAPWFLGSDGIIGRFQAQEVQVFPGGISLKTDLMFGLQFNHWLKTANRVLLRLARIKAKDWPTLQKKLKAVDLKSWLGTQSFFVQVDAEKCRLSNEKFIRTKISEIWPIDENADQKLFLRGSDDEWTLSLDSSGEHLHRRGLRSKIGEAPIRETLAALTLRILSENYPSSALAQVLLVDPMAGSGTFLLEAQSLFLPSRARSFNFQTWKRTPALLKSQTVWGNFPKALLPGKTPFQKVFGIEQDPKTFELLRHYQIPAMNSDFAKVHLNELPGPSHRERWFVTNPPYGRRIEGLDWMREFWPWVEKNQFKRGALWIPRDLKAAFLSHSPKRPDQEYRTLNGGVACEVLLYANL